MKKNDSTQRQSAYQGEITNISWKRGKGSATTPSCRDCHLVGWAVMFHINILTNQPYKFEKGLLIAKFSVLTPKQMKLVKLIDPVSTWQLLNKNEEDATYYVSSLLKQTENMVISNSIGFQDPSNQGTKSPICQFTDGFFKNCATCRTPKCWPTGRRNIPTQIL